VLPALLKDQERRSARKAPDDMVCIGPGKSRDADRRIASLIRRLEDIGGDYRNFPSLSRWNEHPVFVALVREGEAALGPLLECVEKDTRLTRYIESGGFGLRDHREHRDYVSVAQVANDALLAILRFGHGARRALFWGAVGPTARKAMTIPAPDRVANYWLGVLMDDKAGT
jgi:hypothetical protein